MSTKQEIAEILDGIAAQAVAADAGNKEAIVEIGASLEKATSDESDLEAGIQEALGPALKALQAVYEDKVTDASAVVEAVASVIASSAQYLREPDDGDENVGQAVGRLRSVLGLPEQNDASADSGREKPPADSELKESEQEIPEVAPEGDKPDEEEPQITAEQDEQEPVRDDEGTQTDQSSETEQDVTCDHPAPEGDEPATVEPESLPEDTQPQETSAPSQNNEKIETADRDDEKEVFSAAPAPGSDEQDAAAEVGPTDNTAATEDAAPPRLPEDTDRDILREFTVESLDHISAAEASLLDLESNPDDSEQVNTVFRAFHTIKGTSGFLGLDHIQKLAHLAENLLDRVRDGEIRIIGGYADLALNSCDALRTMIEGLEGLEAGELVPMPQSYDDLIEQLSDPEAAGVNEETDSDSIRTGDILVAKGRAEREQVEQAAQAQGQNRIGQTLVEQGAVKPSDVADAVRTQQKVRGRSADATVRVGTNRLDSLIDAVGELVIAQSMVAQDPAVTEGASPHLSRNVAHAGKIVRELQDVGMSLRMVPLKSTFAKMARLVRDLARKAGKKVKFSTEGEETEIDRNMVEVLNDPLVHMMRNAVDHGIETPEQRAAAGKSPDGMVHLRAYQSAGNVVLELSDDGKGLDRGRILAKAKKRGLVKSGDNLSDSDVYGLIFRAGFSTAEQVTDVSGRGVGMDVVKNGIESLRGRVDVSSRPGEGSTFTIRLPLTMAITDAMLLRVGQQRYLLPIVSIERSFRPEGNQISTVAGQGEMVMVRGELLPVFRLYELFGVSDAATDVTQSLLIIVEGEGSRYALMVDELLGQQQVVIKSLGQSLGQVPGVSGGAILGDGRVGLILDAAGIVELSTAGGKAAETAA